MSMKNTKRREFLGLNTTLEVKTALDKEAKKANTSVSFLTHAIIAKELRRRGYDDCKEGSSNAEYRKSS
jgi:hypothetical protein